MTDKKVYMTLFIILIVFFLVMFFALGIPNILQEAKETTLLVGDNTIFTYQKKKWRLMTDISAKQELDWKKYHVFLEGEYKGEFSLWNEGKWYAFDEEKNGIPLEGTFLAYTSNRSISVFPFTLEEIENKDIVSSFLQEKGLDPNSEFTASYQTSFDFDGDGSNETFYLVSNVFPDFEVSQIFSFVFMMKENQIYPIYEEVLDNLSFNGCKPYFHTFLDLDEDNTYEMILSCGRYSVDEPLNMLFQFRNGEFKNIVSSE